MEEYYLTENVFYDFDKKCIFSNNSNNLVQLNKQNWKKNLQDFDLFDLPDIWDNRIIHDNNIIAVKDCGADGDCLFNVISEAFNLYHLYSNNEDYEYYDAKLLREVICNCIDDDIYFSIIEIYKMEYDGLNFLDDWNPYEIKNKEELRNVIKTCGNTFWGDHMCLELLKEQLKFNVIIMKDDEDKIYPTADILDKYEKTIIIYYIDEIHFQLVTAFIDNKLITIFDNDYPIPNDILIAYKQDTKS